MKLLISLVTALFLLILTACSDGSQVSTKIEELLKDKKLKIENVVLLDEGERREFAAGEILLDGQFLRSGDEYISLSGVRKLRVNGSTLEVSF